MAFSGDFGKYLRSFYDIFIVNQINSFEMSSGRKRSISGPSCSTEPSSKRKRYFSTYQKSWESEFKWLKDSDRGTSHAFCSLCISHFYIGSSAKADVIRHAKTQNHIKLLNAQNQSKSISSFLPSSKTALNDKITNAEVLYSNFIAEHNVPFTLADHFTKLCKKMFPDSEIAKGYSCGRTKTTQIISTSLHDDVVMKCKTQPFTILCDESNDQGDNKCFVILVRLYDTELGKTLTRFLDMPVVLTMH